MGMAEFGERQARFLSGGMKQKLMLASTLMHEPDLLLLDEPTTGVDPVSRREFWRILAGIHEAGRTVLVATPYMDEAERCTHIAFMDAGRITRTGTPEELKAAVPGTLLEISAPDPRAVIAALAGAPGVASAHLLGDVVRVLTSVVPGRRTPDPRLRGDLPSPISAPARDGIQAVTDTLRAAGVAATVREVPMDMESVFAYLADEQSQEAP
jgi:ABC-2 type transport system ATP-binding protein